MVNIYPWNIHNDDYDSEDDDDDNDDLNTAICKGVKMLHILSSILIKCKSSVEYK